MTGQEKKDLENWIVEQIQDGMAEHADDADANEDVKLPEYVPLPVGPNEHLAIIVPKERP
jgi:hypothetical protein